MLDGGDWPMSPRLSAPTITPNIAILGTPGTRPGSAGPAPPAGLLTSPFVHAGRDLLDIRADPYPRGQNVESHSQWEWLWLGSPYGIRTRAATLRGWCPRPLDERARLRADETLSAIGTPMTWGFAGEQGIEP